MILAVVYLLGSPYHMCIYTNICVCIYIYIYVHPYGILQKIWRVSNQDGNSIMSSPSLSLWRLLKRGIIFFSWVNPLHITIFNSHVQLAEGARSSILTGSAADLAFTCGFNQVLDDGYDHVVVICWGYSFCNGYWLAYLQMTCLSEMVTFHCNVR